MLIDFLLKLKSHKLPVSIKEYLTLLERRLRHARDLAEKLFALIMLGDDRALAATWAMGREVYSARRQLPR